MFNAIGCKTIIAISFGRPVIGISQNNSHIALAHQFILKTDSFIRCVFKSNNFTHTRTESLAANDFVLRHLDIINITAHGSPIINIDQLYINRRFVTIVDTCCSLQQCQVKSCTNISIRQHFCSNTRIVYLFTGFSQPEISVIVIPYTASDQNSQLAGTIRFIIKAQHVIITGLIQIKMVILTGCKSFTA